MLLKVNLKPIKVMITCKKLVPYLKIPTRYWHLKIGSKWDFVIPWPTKIAVTRSIFEIEGSNFGFSPLFVCSTNAILQLRFNDEFKKKKKISTPSEGGWGKNFKSKFCPKFSFLMFRKSQEVSIQDVKLLRSNNGSPKTVK